MKLYVHHAFDDEIFKHEITWHIKLRMLEYSEVAIITFQDTEFIDSKYITHDNN